LPQKKYADEGRAGNFFEQLEARVVSIPGVQTVGLITELPMSGQLNDLPFTVEGRPPVTVDQAFDADFRLVNQHYFNAMRIPLLRGRNFTEQEIRESKPVSVVSQQLVDTVFPKEDPLGKRLISAISNQAVEIIGVVGDIRHNSLGVQPFAAMYFPTRDSGRMNLVIRTQNDPLSIVGAVRQEVHALDPDQPVAAVKRMSDWVDSSVAVQRYRTTLLGAFAALAMILAATGIYGVMSYTVAQRTHEIGVRMALGARRLDVMKLVVRQGMVLTLVGVIVGLVGAWALTRVMASLLFGVTAKDPLTFAAVAGLLSAVAFIACFVPALRATKVDPLVALRYE
jgi:putative ABC transport system permease protein